jgi:hypothetical protein
VHFFPVIVPALLVAVGYYMGFGAVISFRTFINWRFVLFVDAFCASSSAHHGYEHSEAGSETQSC